MDRNAAAMKFLYDPTNAASYEKLRRGSKELTEESPAGGHRACLPRCLRAQYWHHVFDASGYGNGNWS